jgi:hypothetical protein
MAVIAVLMSYHNESRMIATIVDKYCSILLETVIYVYNNDFIDETVYLLSVLDLSCSI